MGTQAKLIFMLLLGVCFFASSVSHALGSPSAFDDAIRAASQRVEDATNQAKSRRQAYRRLVDRISSLKRKSKLDSAESSELARLLERSLVAEVDLRQAQLHLMQSENQLKAKLREAIEKIDKEIRKLVEEIKIGALSKRKKAAQVIRELASQRQKFRESLAKMARPSDDRHRWLVESMEVGPLDGPRELEDKADFLEDTIDKLRAKRKILKRLSEQAAQEQHITLASREFEMDISVFEEEARPVQFKRSQSQAQPAADNESPIGSDSLSPPVGAGNPVSAPSPPPPSDSPPESFDPPSDTPSDTPREQNPPASAPDPIAVDSTSLEKVATFELVTLDMIKIESQPPRADVLKQLQKQLKLLEENLAKTAVALRARARKLEAPSRR